MEGQKRATSAIDRKNPRESGHDRHQQPGGIQFKNQEKKKKKKQVYSLKSSRPFFLYGRSLENRELHEYDVHGGGNTKNYQESAVCCIVYRNKGNVRSVQVFPFRRFRL
jgi:hypothetical protein